MQPNDDDSGPSSDVLYCCIELHLAHKTWAKRIISKTRGTNLIVKNEGLAAYKVLEREYLYTPRER